MNYFLPTCDYAMTWVLGLEFLANVPTCPRKWRFSYHTYYCEAIRSYYSSKRVNCKDAIVSNTWIEEHVIKALSIFNVSTIDVACYGIADQLSLMPEMRSEIQVHVFCLTQQVRDVIFYGFFIPNWGLLCFWTMEWNFIFNNK